jgi:O-Antigen ligase
MKPNTIFKTSNDDVASSFLAKDIAKKEHFTSNIVRSKNLPEKLIWNYIVYNYLIYFLGAQFILAPMMAWFLLGYMVVKWWNQNEDTPKSQRIHVSITSWVWLGATILIAITHFVGCLEYDIDTYVTLRDFFNGWIRMWALFAIFPLIACLDIRPQLIVRAVCIFCAQSLILVVLFWIISFLNDGQGYTYISPLYKFGGQLNHYTVVIGNVVDVTEKRLYMIAPWAPALGLLASIYFFLAMQEADKKWRYLGMIGSAALILSTFSRTAIFGVPIVYIFILTISKIFQPWTQFAWGITSFIASIFGNQIGNIFQEFISGVKQYRGGSTRAREELNQLAFNAWKDESPIWGHGSYFEKSSVMAGSRNYASDSTLYGILYSNGSIGALAVAAIFIWAFFNLLPKIHKHPYAKVGLAILSMIFIFINTENIQATAYIYWPGLVILGSVFKEV